MNSFDRFGNDADLSSSSIKSSSSDVYEGFEGLGKKMSKDSKHAAAAASVSQRTRRSYDWSRMDRQQEQEGEMMRRSGEQRGKVEYYGQDPLELLRKLDELKDQINRSCQVNEKPSYPSQPPPPPSSSSSSSSYYYMDRREMDMHRFYPTHQFPHHVQRFEPYHLNDEVIHDPSCSCSYCSRNPHHHQVAGHPSSSGQPRWEGDLNSELVGFSRNSHKIPSGRCCYPIAGGSPFVTCYNCFKLLQIPRKVLFLTKNPKKMQCGACLTVLLLEVVSKKLAHSVSVSELPQISNKAVGYSLPRPPQTVNEGSSLFIGRMIQEETLKLSSDDSGYDFQDMSNEPTTSSSIHNFKSDKSTSPHSSMGDDNTPENSDDYAEIMPAAVKLPPPPPHKGSSLQDYIDYSNIYRKADQFDKGNQSESSEKDLGMPKKAFLQEDSMKDASFATEIDVSFQYSISVTSQESGDASIKGSSMTNKQESFMDYSGSSHLSDQDTIINVTVNGNDIPDHLVKKAEKQAGPIKPGNYWYDFKAGFWGVMGGPCLGIIPPFIEELNYPMAGNCSDGESGVFVNGRELHQKDFERLCSRGLPSATNRSYEIEMSGRVIDAISGEKLKGLGRLAPSVEKSMRGFGMKPPRKVAA